MKRARCSVVLPLLALSLSSRIFGAVATTYTVSEGESIQDAIDLAEAGDTVSIEEGEYWEDIETKNDGTSSGPITITGASGTNVGDVVLRGGGGWRMLHIKHDYILIKDFTIDGRVFDGDNNDYEEAYRDKLIYAMAEREHTERSGGYDSAIDGLEIRDMVLKNGGAECLRLRYFVTYAKIHDNEILDCGIYDFRFDDGGKTGEGVYIGTSTSQWDDSSMPTRGPDICQHVHVYNNYINTKGNEGIQVKEGVIDTLIENNEIHMQLDDDSGGVDCRGDRCVVRNNHIEDCEGAGIRLGGRTEDGVSYGQYNDAYGNTLVNCQFAGIKVTKLEQGIICENDITPPDGASNYHFTRGNGASEYPDPSVQCPPSPTPTPPTPSAEPTPDQTPSPVPTPPTPSPVPTPSGTIGCFTDFASRRIMTRAFIADDMTNGVCALYCKDMEMEYSGTQYSEECWCSDSDNFDRHGSSQQCNMECTGNANEICGGIYAMTVSRSDDYDGLDEDGGGDDSGSDDDSSGSDDDDISSDDDDSGSGDDDSFDEDDYEFLDGYLGCFADEEGDRALDEHILESSSMSIQKCIDYCDEKGEDYAGTQQGNECWCGSDDMYDKHGSSDDCTMECEGDDDQICGGNLAMSVYEVNDR